MLVNLKKIKRKIIYFLALIVFFPCFVNAKVIPLKFGIYASDRLFQLEKKFSPILEQLEKNMSQSTGDSVAIELVFFPTYEGGIEALVKGDVDFARLGPVSYVLAKEEEPELAIIATESNQGKKSFDGVVCVAKDSSIQTLSELKGKKFAFGNIRSTSGRYMAQKYLLEEGVKASDFDEFSYLRQHGKVALAVISGLFDAGAFKSGVLKNEFIQEQLRVIGTFPVVTHPWTVRKNINPELYQHLKKGVLELKDPAIFKGLKRSGFLPGDDTDYEAIRQAIHNNYLFFD